jgi:hypothetical protein
MESIGDLIKELAPILSDIEMGSIFPTGFSEIIPSSCQYNSLIGIVTSN